MNSKPIVPICAYIKPDGIRCGTPARRGRPFCHTHNRVLSGAQIPVNHTCRVIPPLKTRYDIRTAATNILRDLRDGRLDLPTARAMGWVLSLANNTLEHQADLDKLRRTVFRRKTDQLLSFPELAF